MANIVNNPALPYVTMIPGGFAAGSAITFKGKIAPGKDSRFALNLSSGLLVDGDHRDDIALHFNPRLDQNEIILNHMVNNVWGVEQKYPLSGVFEVGKGFEIRVLGLANLGYKIAINGRHFCDFPHKIPLNEVKTLYVWGCLELDFIEFQSAHSVLVSGTGTIKRKLKANLYGATSGASSNDPPFPSATSGYSNTMGSVGAGDPPLGGAPSLYPSPTPGLGWTAGAGGAPYAHANAPPPAYGGTKGIMSAPKENVEKLPFEIRVPVSGDGLAVGQRLDATLTIKKNAASFYINFMSGNDVAFHFNPRFENNGSVLVVRNTKRHGVWGNEETTTPYGYFNRGQTVDVSVNGSYFIHYKHRVPISMIDTIIIDGDCKILRVFA